METKKINEHIKYIFEEKDLGKTLKHLAEKVDNSNGKLYKYCYFDSNNYSIGNIKNNIIHFSIPHTFNDPFDSTLAISIESILKQMLENNPKLFNENSQEENSIIIDLLFADNKEDINTPMNRFVNNPITRDLILNAILKKETRIDENELYMVLAQNIGQTQQLFHDIKYIENMLKSPYPKLYIDLIKSLDMNTLQTLLGDSIDEVELNLIRIIKYGNIFERLEAINNLNQGIKIDYNFKDLSRTVEKAQMDITRLINDRFCITCFSTDPKNILMWSHYSSKHTGFCIEYDLNRFSKEEIGLTAGLLPVIYSTDRAMFPLEIFDFSDMNNIKLKNDDIMASAKLVIALLTKSNIWSYEKEWRIIMPKDNVDQELNTRLSAISCIYFGANISLENKRQLISLLSLKNPSVKQVQLKLDATKYFLLEEEI